MRQFDIILGDCNNWISWLMNKTSPTTEEMNTVDQEIKLNFKISKGLIT